MEQSEILIWIAIGITLILGPLLLGSAGLIHGLRERGKNAAGAATRWNWRLTISSALFFVLAFNLIFFIQELFLVLPKALAPDLRPVLYHNNHSWDGENPLANLLQGTGALAILIVGTTCVLSLKHGAGRSTAGRLFLVWMAYNGLYQSLSQIVIGAINPRNDVGMAMEHLRLGETGPSRHSGRLP